VRLSLLPPFCPLNSRGGGFAALATLLYVCGVIFWARFDFRYALSTARRIYSCGISVVGLSPGISVYCRTKVILGVRPCRFFFGCLHLNCSYRSVGAPFESHLSSRLTPRLPGCTINKVLSRTRSLGMRFRYLDDQILLPCLVAVRVAKLPL
jgi:hypothetical protein